MKSFINIYTVLVGFGFTFWSSTNRAVAQPAYGKPLEVKTLTTDAKSLDSITIVRPDGKSISSGNVKLIPKAIVQTHNEEAMIPVAKVSTQTKPLSQATPKSITEAKSVNFESQTFTKIAPFLPSNSSDALGQLPPAIIQDKSTAQNSPGIVNPDPIRQLPPQITTPPTQVDPPEPPALQGIPPEIKRQIINVKIKNALSNTALIYPFILNPTDRVTFTPSAFRPLDKDYYLEFDLRSGATGDPNVAKVTTGFFPKDEQFYWVLPDNKIVFETTGYQIGLLYQGRSRDLRLESVFRQIQSYNGLQFVTVIPSDLGRLQPNRDNINDNSQRSILSVVGQINNPPGIPAPQVTTIINQNLDNAVVFDSNSIQFPLNGGELFSQLAVNEPVLLQAFPTIDLSPLANTDLREGGRVTAAELAQAGITFGNVLTGRPPEITAPVTSVPGIKVGQLGKFDNTDLLRVLIDRSLTPSERRFRYLNSLQWVSLGIRVDSSELSDILRGSGPRQRLSEDASNDWYRAYLSLPHKRSFIQYDSKDAVATFAQIFSNPGLSASVNGGSGTIDNQESLNPTLGLLVGGLFRLFNPGDVNSALISAKELREKGEDFTPLTTPTSSEQRRNINRRVNTSLGYANFTSRIEQVSGSLIFPSQASTENFSSFQFRTGLSRRGIGFSFQSEPTFSEGDIFYRTVRLSDDSFGLGFSNSLTPVPVNESFFGETLITSPSGEQVLFRAGSTSVTPVPIPTRAATIAFDRLEIQRDAIRTDRANVFNGFQFLPTAELNFSGSSNEFNYSISSGAWLNLNNNAIFNVQQNTNGTSEPAFGLYFNALLNLINVDTKKDEQGNVVTANTTVPSINVRFNTSANTLNPSLASVSYSFTRSTRESNLFVTPSVSFVSSEQDERGFLNGALTTSLALSLQLQSLQFSGSIELGNSTFYQIEGFNSFSNSFGAGLFYHNFTDFLAGTGRRAQGSNAGVRVRYSFDNSPFGVDASVSSGAGGLESRIQGTLRF